MDSTSRGCGLTLEDVQGSRIVLALERYRPFARQVVQAYHECAVFMTPEDMRIAKEAIRDGDFYVSATDAIAPFMNMNLFSLRSPRPNSKIRLWIADCLFTNNPQIGVQREHIRIDHAHTWEDPSPYPAYGVPVAYTGVRHNRMNREYHPDHGLYLVPYLNQRPGPFPPSNAQVIERVSAPPTYEVAEYKKQKILDRIFDGDLQLQDQIKPQGEDAFFETGLTWAAVVIYANSGATQNCVADAIGRLGYDARNYDYAHLRDETNYIEALYGRDTQHQ